jgi:hypothetical protein
MLNQPSAAAAGLAAYPECYFLFWVPTRCTVNHWSHQGDGSVMHRLTSQDLPGFVQRGVITIGIVFMQQITWVAPSRV